MENVWMAKGTAAFSPRIFVSQKETETMWLDLKRLQVFCQMFREKCNLLCCVGIRNYITYVEPKIQNNSNAPSEIGIYQAESLSV